MLAGKNIEIREGTTRYVNISCRDRSTGAAFDFTGYDVQTWVGFGGRSQYVPTAVDASVVRFKIPADLSVGAKNGTAETRIFKNGDVFEVLQMSIIVYKAKKPDMEWHAPDADSGGAR